MSIRERIIEEATRLFSTYGVKALRMDDIATNLGISKRTIYEVFGDKENLITECLRHYTLLVEERKRAKTAHGKTVIDQMMILLDDWDTDMDINYKMMAGLKKFYPRIFEKISSENARKGYTELRKKIEDGVEEGLLLSNLNYDLAISVFSYSIFGIMSKQNLMLPNNVSEIDAFRYVITYFFRGVATEKGIKLIDEYIQKKEAEIKKKNKQDER